MIEIGEHPLLFYFTGKHDIFSVNTLLGKISATHGISYSSPGPKPSLKRKVRSRVKLITDAVGTKLPNLDLVTDQAVDCRNYYVHGTLGKFSYEVNSDQPIFFTDTLEFVFAASDLIDAGWGIAEWIKQGTTMSHPFVRYCVDYAARLSELEKILT